MFKTYVANTRELYPLGQQVHSLLRVYGEIYMGNVKVLLDSDVLINFLSQETETASNFPLWEAPKKILENVFLHEYSVFCTLFSFLEIRFVLRRKKGLLDQTIESDLNKLRTLIEVVVPGEFALWRGNILQAKHPLDPFDSLTLAIASISDMVLVTRDRAFIEIANQYVQTLTPEDYVSKHLEN